MHGRIRPWHLVVQRNKTGDYSVALKGLHHCLQEGRLTSAIEDASEPNFRPYHLFLPPEVLAGEEMSAKGDVWAMGVTFYSLVMAKFPFSVSEILTQAPL